MTALVVNGERRILAAPPRTHLADVLRDELLLTATHIGCEHGVCGACTVLIDGAPARSCLTFPALCEGADIRTLEGLEDDPVIAALRAAFTAEHALQCGYCTPGMLVTARDIVTRLPQADEARVRLELAGNLCRCTGYQGIVQAILKVLAAPPPAPKPAAAPPPTPSAPPPAPPIAAPAPAGTRLTLRQSFALTPEALWTALQDPAFLVACVPGAALTARDGDRLAGELHAGLGPIKTRFVGEGRLSFDPPAREGVLEGEGRDSLSATRASGRLGFRVFADPKGAALEIAADYSLRGPLAQLARPAVVAAFAQALIADFARRLEAALTGAAPPSPWRSAWRWLIARLRARHD